PARWCTARSCCLPTNPPATSTTAPAAPSANCCSTCTAKPAPRWCWSPTTWISRAAATACCASPTAVWSRTPETPVRMLLELAWRDLRGASRTLWVFCACLALGVALIAASSGVHRQVGDALLANTRALFGGDVEVRSRAPLNDDVLNWMN